MKLDIGPYRVELTDDGSLDTVLVVYYRVSPSNRHTVRFNHEYAAEFRHPQTGAMTRKGFRRLADEAVDDFVDSQISSIPNKPGTTGNEQRAQMVCRVCGQMIALSRIMTNADLMEKVLSALLGEDSDAANSVLEAGMADIDVMMAGNDLNTIDGLKSVIKDSLKRCDDILQDRI